MINLKLRLQNKVTLMAILGAIFLLAQQLGIKLPSNIADIANTAVTLLVLLGVVTDPTTKGLSDSEQALTYHEPKKQEGAMRAITRLALILAIAILYVPLSVIALIFYPFLDKEDR